MKIGVSGASGQLGKATVDELLNRGGGHRIVGISRTPSGMAADVEARSGDYDRPDTLVTAYDGLDRLLLIPSADLRPGVRGRQLTAAIEAAARAGVGHIYLVSSAGTKEAEAPSLGEPYWTGEQHLIRTAPRWTILRMNYYAETLIEELKSAIGQGAVAGLGAERVAYVSRDDLAAAAAGALTTNGHSGAIYNITGPEVITGEDKAALLSHAVGKPIRYVVISKAELRAGLSQAGLPDPLVDVIIDIKKGFLGGTCDILTTDVERLSGRKATALKDLLTKAQIAGDTT